MERKTEEERAYEYWLASLQGISTGKKKKLREYKNSAKGVYYIEETECRELRFLTEEDKQILRQAQKSRDFEKEWEQIAGKGIWMSLYCEETYPDKLREISDPPYVLYIKGNLPDDRCPGAAVVGARKCTRYGEIYAGKYAEVLATAGVQIISGLARGIDGFAHRGALNGGGRTFAVLGCGVDICYPREHIGLYMDILEHGGGILSEVPPGTQPLAFHFPRRNRIISGLSDYVLVMEAREKSGSLITVDMALEQGRDIWALPGPVDSALSKGCNLLIRQGAGILITPEMMLEDLQLQNINFLKNQTETKKTLEREENMVYSSFGLYPKSLDEVIEETKLSAPTVMSLLAGMEIKGYIKEISKNYYIRVD